MLPSLCWMFSVSPKWLLLIFPHGSSIPLSYLVSFLSLYLHCCTAVLGWCVCPSHQVWSPLMAKLRCQKIEGAHVGESFPFSRISSSSIIGIVLYSPRSFPLHPSLFFEMETWPHSWDTIIFIFLWHVFSRIHWASGVKQISPAPPVSCKTEAPLCL